MNDDIRIEKPSQEGNGGTLKVTINRRIHRFSTLGFASTRLVAAIVFTIAALALFFVSLPLAGTSNDPIFKAMQDELDRSMSKLVIEDMPAPYFMSYQIVDEQSISIDARYDAVVRSEKSNERSLAVAVRVGDYNFDNSNYYNSWRDIRNMREDLVEEDNYDALRHEIWRQTDAAYKTALENLARKKAYLQTHPTKETIPDFTEVEPNIYLKEPISLDLDAEATESMVEDIAGALSDYPSLQDWNVEFHANATNKRYINSEGSRYLKGNAIRSLEISATTQAEDGQRLSSFLTFLFSGDEVTPSSVELIVEVRKMAGELENLVSAETLDEYVGPVLFTDYAAAQFISQLFASQLAMPRKALMEMDWMNSYLPTGKLAGKVKRRIMPDFVSITDEPRHEEWHGQKLAGFSLIDDEAVPSQDIVLVDDGRLLTLPMTRQPSGKVSASNGHACILPYQITIPRITNLVVTPSKAYSMKKMMKQLKRLCREQDIEYGLMITRLDEPGITDRYRWIDKDDDDEALLTTPIVVYKVYADDNRTELVRGLQFETITIRVLRDIAAMGKDVNVYNLMHQTVFSRFEYPASIITPSILVEEMELNGGGVREPLPVAENPIFSK